jgi:hypothetical protein
MNKRQGLGGGAVVMLALLGAQPPGALADTFRCGREMAVEGDTLYDVRSRCGEPDNQVHRTEIRTKRDWVRTPCGSKDEQQCGHMEERSVEVVIDEWTYDFGPQQFVQNLRFEQGRLVGVAPGGRGSKKKSSTAAVNGTKPTPTPE